MSAKNRRILFGIFGITAILSGLLLVWIFFAKDPVIEAFSNREELVKFVQRQGIFGPIFYILLQIFQTIIAPIPGNIVGAVGGFLFGTWGILWTTIGSTTGALIVFCLARKYGRELVLKLVKQKDLGRFDKIPEDRAGFVFFLFFLIPGLPDDVISYAAGLSKVPISKLVVLWAVGRLPAVVVTNYIGMGVEEGDLGRVAILLGASAVIVAVIALENKKIIKFFEKKTKREKSKSPKKSGSREKKKG